MLRTNRQTHRQTRMNTLLLRLVGVTNDEKARVVPDLSLHVHDDDRVGPVTNDELFNITRQWMNAMHSDVRASETSQRLERVETLRTLHVPHLYRTV